FLLMPLCPRCKLLMALRPRGAKMLLRCEVWRRIAAPAAPVPWRVFERSGYRFASRKRAT
ncbi:hypothetical protein KC221_30645, partial [Mycobacterium tuberculosis]|nr:hypothetical protein [Mycobacterium tuberculosis]